MIKATLNNGDLLLGISEENVKRLKQGKPMAINLEEIGVVAAKNIYIIYGETETAIYEQLKEGMNTNTKIHGAPRS